MYHIVCPVKFKKKIFTKEVENTLKTICDEISQRYEIKFLEIGIDDNHVHFLVKSTPDLSVTIIKSISARELFKVYPEIKKFFWGTILCSSGYYANTVGKFGSEQDVRKYINTQGKGYSYNFLTS